MTEREHVHYFDHLRIMAAICVIVMHFAGNRLVGEMDLDWQIFNLLVSFCFTAVPLFFMMSGYLLLSQDKSGDISLLLKRRLPRLAIPLAGWTVVTVLYDMFVAKNWSLAAFGSGLLSALSTPAQTPYWYMYTLIAMYAISPILAGGLRSLDQTGHRYTLLLVIAVSVRAMARCLLPGWADPVLNVDFVERIAFFSGNLATFVLGYYLGRLDKRIPNGLLYAVCVGLLGIITAGTALDSRKQGFYDATFQSQNAGFEVLLAACLFLLFKQNRNKPVGTLEKPLVALSLPIYLMHNLLLNVMYGLGFAVRNLWDLLVCTLVNLVVCYLATKTAATIKPICYLATGMSYDRACRCCNWAYTYKRLVSKEP